VSGANLAIVAGAALALSRLAGLPLAPRAIFAALAMIAFAIVARPSPSVLRALLMGLVAVLALGTGRAKDGLAALSVAVLLLILFAPDLARSYGFALSVAATAGILLLAPRWRTRLTGDTTPSPPDSTPAPRNDRNRSSAEAAVPVPTITPSPSSASDSQNERRWFATEAMEPVHTTTPSPNSGSWPTTPTSGAAPTARKGGGRWPRWAAEAVVVPAAAQAAVTPVLVLMSGEISLVAVPANLLAGPAVAPATLLGFVAALIAPFWPEAAQVLVIPAGYAVGWIITVSRWAAGMPLANLPWPQGITGLGL